METGNSLTFSLVRWTRATFLGWLAGVVLILILSSLLDAIGIEHMQFYLGIGIGAGVGFMQWLMFKRIVLIPKNWMIFSVLGLSIPFLILDLLPEGIVQHKIAWSILLGGLAVGLLQRGILKNFSQHANLWIVACLVAWPLAVLTVFAVDYTKYITSVSWALAILNFFLILAGGVVLGLVSGIFLKRMIKT
ncbi:MAG: hypothetical protein JNM57_01605 [Cyclobacteriaceae bacterium]|nr:hypothetical protein [Cyclobacteriaceae bacterium]